MRKVFILVLAVSAFLLWAAAASAQITVPHVFVADTVSDPVTVNTNFSTIAAQALNRTGGILTGNVTASSGVTVDGIDVGLVLGGSGTLGLTTLTTSGTYTAGTGTAAGGMPGATVKTIQAIYNSTSASGDIYAVAGQTKQTVATSGAAYGLAGYVYTSHGSGNVAATGVRGDIELAGAGNITTARSVQATGILGGSGGVTDWRLFDATPWTRTGSGTVTNGVGFYSGTFPASVTNKYSFYSADATATQYFPGLTTMGAGATIGSMPTNVKLAKGVYASTETVVDETGAAFMWRSSSNLAASGIGLHGYAYSNASGTTSSLYGAKATVDAAGTGTVGTTEGLLGTVWLSAAGTLTSAHGVRGLVQTTAGTVDTAVGLYANVRELAGTITNGYGVLVDFGGSTFANKYSFSSAETDAVFVHAGRMDLSNQVRLITDVSPAALAAGSTHDYAPGGVFNSAFVLRLVPNAANSALGGLTGGAQGRVLWIVNAGSAGNLTLTHEAGGSTATNRFYSPGAADTVIAPFGSVMLWYDNPSSRWRVLAK